MESASSTDHMSDASADHRHSRLSFDSASAPAADAIGPDGQHHQTTSRAADGDTFINWNLLMKYVNVNLVRNMIAQHAAELIVLSVIIIYLVYYFSRISKRPKLVGAKDSKFVKMIRDNFKDPLERRFNPLIYFWGTNPQTALFGYLQGQTSDDEVPRSKFKRQHLFVSDLQYLATNVDLSQYYEQRLERPTAAGQLDRGQLLKLKTNHRLGHLQQLDASHLLATSYNVKLTSSKFSNNINIINNNNNNSTSNNNNNDSSLLNQNIRLATSDRFEMVAARAAKAKFAALERKESGIEMGEEEEQEEEQLARLKHFQQEEASLALVKGQAAGLLKSLTRTASSDSSDSSAMGSSSDSGVFATGANSSLSGSSSHSGSSLTIDIDSSDKSAQRTHKHSHHQRLCSCIAPYELEMQSFPEQPRGLVNSPSFDQADFLKFSAIKQQHREEVRREQLEFGQCALDWFLDSHKHYHKNKQVALISAGMTTGSDKKYVTDTIQTLDKLGYEVCVFIRRGVGGLKLSSTKFFSPSKWRDFEAAILSIHKQRPGARLVAIGFSFGSIELCRYLSMSGPESLVDSALLISCPFDPEAGGRNMRKRLLNRKIDAYLAKNLGKQLYQALAENFSNTTSEECEEKKTEVERKQQIHINYNGSAVDLSSLPKIKSLVDFEDNYNRVIQNYPSSDAYAADSRLSELLANISTPTLCLSSEDDFMAPTKLLPIKQIEANKNICMILTKRGGHMAFIDGLLWPKRPYFAQRIIEKYMKLNTSWMTTSHQALLAAPILEPNLDAPRRHVE